LSRRAFVTIEILVAMVIGFLAIIMLTSSIKSLQKIILQQQNYEELYITVLSLKDTIVAKKCYEHPLLEGSLNGFSYTIECKEEKTLKNYHETYNDSGEAIEDNYGIFMIYLFDVTIEVRGDGLRKSYQFYQSEQERLVSDEELMNDI